MAEEVYKAVWGVSPGEPLPFTHDDLTRDSDEPQEDPSTGPPGRGGRMQFRNTKYPALVIAEGLRFVGGRLEAEGPAAERVLAYAAARPLAGIQVLEGNQAPQAASGPSGASDGPAEGLWAHTRAELREIAHEAGLPTGGSKAQLVRRIEAAQ